MRKTILLGLLALAACDKGPEVKVTNATPEEVAAKVKESRAGELQLDPGQWQITTSLKLVDAQGMPAGALDQMKAAMQRSSTDTQCLTPEEAKRPNSGLFAGRENSRCKYDSFEMGGGKINASMRCPGASGGEMLMTMEGSYAPKSYKVEAVMSMNMPGEGQKMKMAMQSSGTRIGECAGAAATES